jgi:hypothetical protein
MLVQLLQQDFIELSIFFLKVNSTKLKSGPETILMAFTCKQTVKNYVLYTIECIVVIFLQSNFTGDHK